MVVPIPHFIQVATWVVVVATWGVVALDHIIEVLAFDASRYSFLLL